MKIKGIEFSDKEKEVMKVLAGYEGYRTTREIADKSKISWQVTHRFLNELKAIRWINYLKQGKWEYWKVVIR